MSNHDHITQTALTNETDISSDNDKRQRINISWDSELNAKVDDYLRTTGQSKSGFLAKLASDWLNSSSSDLSIQNTESNNRNIAFSARDIVSEVNANTKLNIFHRSLSIICKGLILNDKSHDIKEQNILNDLRLFFPLIVGITAIHPDDTKLTFKSVKQNPIDEVSYKIHVTSDQINDLVSYMRSWSENFNNIIFDKICPYIIKSSFEKIDKKIFSELSPYRWLPNSNALTSEYLENVCRSFGIENIDAKSNAIVILNTFIKAANDYAYECGMLNKLNLLSIYATKQYHQKMDLMADFLFNLVLALQPTFDDIENIIYSKSSTLSRVSINNQSFDDSEMLSFIEVYITDIQNNRFS